MKKHKETTQAIKKGLKKLGVQFKYEAPAKKKAVVEQDYFYDYCRGSGPHKPDLFIQQDERIVPVEVKSPKELYDKGHYSKVHLCLFLKQTIFGQCFSYGDLYKGDSETTRNRMKVILIVPKLVIDKETQKGLGDIEKVFDTALKPDETCSEIMGIKTIRFEAASFCQKMTKTYGYFVADNETYIATEIFYEI